MIFLPVQRDVHISYKLFICNISTNAVAAPSLINGVSCLHKLYVDISELFNNTEVDSNKGYRAICAHLHRYILIENQLWCKVCHLHLYGRIIFCSLLHPPPALMPSVHGGHRTPRCRPNIRLNPRSTF